MMVKTSGSPMSHKLLCSRDKGSMLPCFISHSESGSITSDLLAAMLQHMDDCQDFDRTDGVPPIFLLDGHGRRFELPFLEYINDEGTHGKCTLECHMEQAFGR